MAPAVMPPSFQPNEASFAIIPQAFGALQPQEVPEFAHFPVLMDALSPHASSVDSLTPILPTLLQVYPIEPLALGWWPLPQSPPINTSSLAPSPANSQRRTHPATPPAPPPGVSASSSLVKTKSAFVPSMLPVNWMSSTNQLCRSKSRRRIKRVPCAMEGCQTMWPTPCEMKRHISSVHLEFTLPCPYEGCDHITKGYRPDNLQRHIRKSHSNPQRLHTPSS